MSKMKSLVTDLGWDGAERYLNQIRKDKKTLIKLAKLIKKEKKNVL